MSSKPLLILLSMLLLGLAAAADHWLESSVPGAGLLMLSFLPLLIVRNQLLLIGAAALAVAALLVPLAFDGMHSDPLEIASRLFGVCIALGWVAAARRYEALHRRLVQSEARLRAAVNALSCIVWIGVPERQESAAGQAEDALPAERAHGAALRGHMGDEWQVFTGQRVHEAAGDGWLRCVHEGDREQLRRLWLRPDANAWPERYDLELRVWHAASASWRFMEARLRPVRDLNDNVIEWLGVLTDAHVRKTAERALAEGDERLKEAQRLARLGQWEYVPEADRVQLSAELSSAFGGTHAPSNMDLDELLRYLVGTPADHIDSLLARVLADGTGMQGEYAVLLPDGSRRVALILARRGVSAEGRVMVWGIAQDITEQVRWREREQALENRLSLSAKMQTVGELSSGLAHDFNNVLASMLGYGELALQRARNLDPELNGYLQHVLGAGRRARDLLRTLMTVGRGKSANDAVGNIELGPVVLETVNLVRAAIPSGIRIHEKIASKVYGRIDRLHLQEAVLNLCVNARDAVGSDGEINIGVQQQRVQGDCAVCGEHVQADAGVVSVIDSGPGVASAVLPRIFEPFFSTKLSGEGTGLGLAMVARLLHAQGAHVLVSSRPGSTRFDLVFPVGADEHRANVVSAEPQLLPEQSSADRRRYCVLVLDDEAPIGRLIGSAFEQSGLQAVVFEDAREAQAAFAADPDRFDLIVTDLTMPSMSGIEFASALRASRPVPILLLTGGGTSDEELHATGVLDQILRKPFSMRELLSMAMQMLQARVPSQARAQLH